MAEDIRTLISAFYVRTCYNFGKILPAKQSCIRVHNGEGTYG